ncbi:hypothetical protein CE91St56_61440 [Lachnospiraceae bacterium]|nr:hypothetical protein CE91St56_61440 [Lachnospiraceae bacterium]GKH45100.1 hypothetical protein CE91St57_60740 [Lachnospiraceae bacterium]
MTAGSSRTGIYGKNILFGRKEFLRQGYDLPEPSGMQAIAAEKADPLYYPAHTGRGKERKGVFFYR